MTFAPFDPPQYLKNQTLQTVLASSKLRTLGRNRMRAIAEEQIINAGNGVRLQGFISRQAKRSQGLVILLHGWEGSERSAYIVTSGKYFFDAGYSVFRLNLRDHGESHHLNEGLFFGTLLQESFNGLKAITEQVADTPVFLIGFSMGGNFAIRMAHHCLIEPLPNLKRVICINPPLDPMQATLSIDTVPMLKRYFIRKWRRSLRKNQALYPHRYDFSDAFAADSCWEMTERLLERYSDYPDPESYFGEYTLKEGILDQIRMPLTLIMSADDPIISADDFRQAPRSDTVELLLQPHGGHCGYIENLRMTAWYWQVIRDRLQPQLPLSRLK